MAAMQCLQVTLSRNNVSHLSTVNDDYLPANQLSTFAHFMTHQMCQNSNQCEQGRSCFSNTIIDDGDDGGGGGTPQTYSATAAK